MWWSILIIIMMINNNQKNDNNHNLYTQWLLWFKFENVYTYPKGYTHMVGVAKPKIHGKVTQIEIGQMSRVFMWLCISIT